MSRGGRLWKGGECIQSKSRARPRDACASRRVSHPYPLHTFAKFTECVYMCVFVCLCLCVRVCSTAPNAGGRAPGRQRKLLLFLLPHHCRSPRPLKGEHVLPLLLFLLLRRRRRRLLLAGARAPKAVLLDRALCLPTFSHFLIVNKLLSLSPAQSPLLECKCKLLARRYA